MEGTRWSLLSAGAVCAALAMGGCGGGGDRQDADEKAGSYQVDVVSAKFPSKQTLAKQDEMAIEVRNAGQQEIPNVAVTVDSFSRRSSQAGLADPERPVWIVDSGPRGGTTAYTNTWALGRLGAGESKVFTWKVTAVRPGTHRVKWRVAAGLDGKAKAVLSGGSDPSGEFVVDINDKPAQARVDPKTGKVVRE
jgi:hypothetical protein